MVSEACPTNPREASGLDPEAVHEAEDFELTLTMRDVEVAITPELVEVVAQEDAYPVIARVRDEYGIVTVALASDLIKAHSNGDITIRQIATLTGLSSGTTYDLVEALYEIHDLGDDNLSLLTYTPDNIMDGTTNLPDELSDE